MTRKLRAVSCPKNRTQPVCSTDSLKSASATLWQMFMKMISLVLPQRNLQQEWLPGSRTSEVKQGSVLRRGNWHLVLMLWSHLLEILKRYYLSICFVRLNSDGKNGASAKDLGFDSWFLSTPCLPGTGSRKPTPHLLPATTAAPSSWWGSEHWCLHCI